MNRRDVRLLGVRAILFAAVALILLTVLEGSGITVALESIVGGLVLAVATSPEFFWKRLPFAAAFLAWAIATLGLVAIGLEGAYLRAALAGGPRAGFEALSLELSRGEWLLAFVWLLPMTFAFVASICGRLQRWGVSLQIVLACIGSAVLAVALRDVIHAQDRAHLSDAALIDAPLFIFLGSVPFAVGVPLLVRFADGIDARLFTSRQEALA